MFWFYLNLGFDHIADFTSFDHILFILTLCAVYALNHWRKVLILITAFTVGHSVSLAMAVFEYIKISSAWVEMLIPLTILITALVNIFSNAETQSDRFHWFKYAMALFFGLIHGLGFSSSLRAMLMPNEGIIAPLFGFNIGVELGQLLIVALFFATYYVFVNRFNTQPRDWKLVISGAGLGVALILILERFQNWYS